MENKPILKEWFDRVDSEKTGNITPIQLKTALAVGNLEFPISIVQQMIRMYDFDKNGTMNFQEFVALNKFLLQVQQAFSDLERGRGFLVPEDVYEVQSSKGCILKKCALVQRDSSFRMVGEYTVLVKIGISLDSPAFYTVCESFDQKKNGRFRLDDLISLCIFVQSSSFLYHEYKKAPPHEKYHNVSRNLFNSFDTSKQGRVTLDLNQFIYCNANCRI